MKDEEYRKLKTELDSLPTGGITYKKINGKEYAYYQWRENGKQRSRRAKDDELPFLLIQIERRKEIENLMAGIGNGQDKMVYFEYPFYCAVQTGTILQQFVESVATWKKRGCFESLHEYLYSDIRDRVFILYGLRRTGKTTLIRQAIYEMDEKMRKRTAFVQVYEGLTMTELYKDLRVLEAKGYQYVFIDEVTLLEDFIEDAALLSDIFAASGMKIVLSGTDSLGFMITKSEQLYDRCFLCHTTFISYSEFEYVLGITGIDEYIRYGGTMSIGGKNYNQNSLIFEDNASVNAYVDSAIAHNIQHSLKHYQSGNHFRSLGELYEKDELTNVINRVVEDINHKFTMEVLTRDFKSSDLSLSAKNLRKDKEQPTDILYEVDVERVTKRLKETLEIRNKTELSVQLENAHRIEIKEYLDLLDLTVEIESRWVQDYNRKESRTVFLQPGMRYAQVKALVDALVQEEMFLELGLKEQTRVIERIMNEVKGRMMEDIILLETKMARPNCQVFKLQFAIGEYDMVVFDREHCCCEIYEIKHSTEAVLEQSRYLREEEKLKATEFRYGDIVGKYVIYRGEETEIEGTRYLNVEDYLKSLEFHSMK